MLKPVSLPTSVEIGTKNIITWEGIKDVFWESVATRINEELGSNFLGHHCKEKFRNLVRDYNVSVSVNSPLKRRRFLNLTFHITSDD